MSSDEQTPVVADAENVKKSDGTSTAGEHSVDRVNDDEQVPQVDVKSTTANEEKDEQPSNTSGATAQEEAVTEQEETEDNSHSGKVNKKRDISEVDQNEKKNGHLEEEDDEAVVSTTSTNKKVKIIESASTENAGNGVDTDDTSSTSAKVPNEELTVV